MEPVGPGSQYEVTNLAFNDTSGSLLLLRPGRGRRDEADQQQRQKEPRVHVGQSAEKS